MCLPIQVRNRKIRLMLVIALTRKCFNYKTTTGVYISIYSTYVHLRSVKNGSPKVALGIHEVHRIFPRVSMQNKI